VKTYPTHVYVRRHSPRKAGDYRKYRNCVRPEFTFRCVYCLTSELELPASPHGGFEIDHFRPVERFPTWVAKYTNLYWACPLCNRSKGKTWPQPDEAKQGFGFVDPCDEPMAEHLSVSGDEVVPKSAKGEYTIKQVGLNSAAHRKRRQQRANKATQLQLLIQLAKTSANRDQALALWAELRGEPYAKPWDAPSDCLCGKSKAAT
jgi:hypothetical protein